MLLGGLVRLTTGVPSTPETLVIPRRSARLGFPAVAGLEVIVNPLQVMLLPPAAAVEEDCNAHESSATVQVYTGPGEIAGVGVAGAGV
jgi:hypothetical protein